MELKFPKLLTSKKQFEDFYRTSTIWDEIKKTVAFLYEEEKERLVHLANTDDEDSDEIIRGRCQVLDGLIATIENYTLIEGETEDE